MLKLRWVWRKLAKISRKELGTRKKSWCTPKVKDKLIESSIFFPAFNCAVGPGKRNERMESDRKPRPRTGLMDWLIDRGSYEELMT